MIKLSDYIIEFIEKLGVRHVFLVPGGGAMHLNDSLGKSTTIKYVCCLHEQACAIAAEAYARITGNMGAAMVTSGPGGTNAVTGVAAAWIESTPVLFISGQVKSEDRIGSQNIRQMGIQEVDIVPVVKPITKYAVTVTDSSSIRYHLEKAAYLARNGRPGPVWLDIPLDIQAALIEPGGQKCFEPVKADNRYEEQLNESVIKTIELLNNSERPVVLAGNGIRLAGACEIFHRFIELLNIPVLTTWNGIDLIWEDHGLFMGRPGSVGQRAANFIQQNSDFFMSVGARLNLLQTGFNYRSFARAAVKVMVDIDSNELCKRNVFPDLPICTDAGKFMELVIAQSHRLIRRDRMTWFNKCREWKEIYPVVLPEFRKEKDFTNSYVLIDAISDAMDNDDIFVSGSSGTCLDVSMQAFKVKKGQRVFATKGLASMGFGLPASISACLASGGKRTVCVNGDGGFQMNIQELETLRRLDLPVKIFVLANDGFATIKTTQNNFFDGRLVACNNASGLSLPDINRVADAYGLRTAEICNNCDIAAKVRWVLETPGPVICKVGVSSEQPVEPRQASYKKADGSMASRPLEDLKPLLDREELKANMLIPLFEE